jgi:hypothetical protein
MRLFRSDSYHALALTDRPEPLSPLGNIYGETMSGKRTWLIAASGENW